MNIRMLYAAIAATTVAITTTAAPAATITDIVASSGGEFDSNPFDYDILLNAVITADLAETLADPDATFTVWAPNDRAFIKTARDLGYEGVTEAGAWEFLVAAFTELGEGDPIPVLTDVLLYHVAGEVITAFDLFFLSFFNQPVVTAQGGTFFPFFFALRDNDPDIRDPFLFFPLNVPADNGIIHTISRVLIPIDLP